jgi:rRNA-processing protein FCF1
MNPLESLLLIATLAILAEVTYLVVKLPRQNLSRKQSRPILVDTSVLIDGRIISVAQSGFIGDTLVIPRSVIGELQFLADNADHDKRARARHGLDVVSELQAMPGIDVEILQDGSKAEEGVDERLLTLAKRQKAVICTIDYNLNKVAVVEGITVLNVNELAQSLRMAYLPGEKMLLELVQKGQDGHQAVGYLPDGTMVVVEHANKLIGQTVEIEFIRSLQTAAGKMMFAKRNEASTSQPSSPKPLRNKKPLGTAPQSSQRAGDESPAVPPQQQQAAPPSVYHSDSRSQRPRKAPVKRSSEQQPQQHSQRPARRRAPSSADREAALIDLLEKSE